MTADQLAHFIAVFAWLVGWPALIAFTFVSTLVLVFGEGPPPHDPRDDFRD
jgi:hypothetical protein